MKQREGDLARGSRAPDRIERQLFYFPDQMCSNRGSEVNPERTQPLQFHVQLMRTSVIMPLAM